MMNRYHHAVRLSPLLLLACLGCQPPTPDVEANKAVVQAVYDAIDAQDYDRLSELTADDFVGHVAGVPEPFDKDAVFEMIRNWYGAFPDYVHVVEAMVAEDDRVAVRLTYNATHQGEFEGIPATGNRISYAGAHMVTVVDGQVQEMWVLEDMLGLMTQLGMQLVPAEQDI
ncbi:MAG: ester cyclase [Gemmatimonadales bacterium]